MADDRSTIPTAIDGLVVLLDFIADAAEERALLERIDAQPWSDALRTRRVQHYGWRYDYGQRTLDSARLGPLPPWLAELAARLVRSGCVKQLPDQVIINEYLPGQGIGAHIDDPRAFGPQVCTLSLGSDVDLQFQQRNNTTSHVTVRTRRRAVYVLSGAARYEWTHAIAPRRSDVVLGQRVHRQRRVSVTFRTVVVNNST
jgi:alkylated DNA repair dioxygenase AlkB